MDRGNRVVQSLSFVRASCCEHGGVGKGVLYCREVGGKGGCAGVREVGRGCKVEESLARPSEASWRGSVVLLLA